MLGPREIPFRHGIRRFGGIDASLCGGGMGPHSVLKMFEIAFSYKISPS